MPNLKDFLASTQKKGLKFFNRVEIHFGSILERAPAAGAPTTCERSETDVVNFLSSVNDASLFWLEEHKRLE